MFLPEPCFTMNHKVGSQNNPSLKPSTAFIELRRSNSMFTVMDLNYRGSPLINAKEKTNCKNDLCCNQARAASLTLPCQASMGASRPSLPIIPNPVERVGSTARLRRPKDLDIRSTSLTPTEANIGAAWCFVWIFRHRAAYTISKRSVVLPRTDTQSI